jgi:hypothetical protein
MCQLVRSQTVLNFGLPFPSFFEKSSGLANKKQKKKKKAVLHTRTVPHSRAVTFPDLLAIGATRYNMAYKKIDDESTTRSTSTSCTDHQLE